MSVVVQNRNGYDVTFLNPQEKRDKYFRELKDGVKITNTFKNKMRNGKNVRLNDTQRAYRSGYLAAQNDSAKAFKSKHPDYKPKKQKKSKTN